jgi:hypothetical protein
VHFRPRGLADHTVVLIDDVEEFARVLRGHGRFRGKAISSQRSA